MWLKMQIRKLIRLLWRNPWPRMGLMLLVFTLLGSCDENVRSIDEGSDEELTKIIFLSNKNGEPGIYTMNEDGSDQIRLSESGEAPQFSPDGSKIVFFKLEDYEIYIMDEDGSNQKNLTNNAVEEFLPLFSPDGSKIVYTSAQDIVAYDIYIMNLDGGNKLNLTPGDNLYGYAPSFSPDGSKIVFQVNQPNITESSAIAVMNINGDSLIYLTGNSDQRVSHHTPHFTPDGENIIFISLRNLYIMKSDGSDLRKLYGDGVSIFSFEISHDGTQIAYSVLIGPTQRSVIHIIDIDGTNEIDLTDNLFWNYLYQFSEDDSQILYASSKTGTTELFLINSDGSEDTQLTTEGGWAAFFQPQR